jgi:hypothetical protein
MRKVVIAVLLFAMLLLGSTVMAQDACGGLSEADCAIITASNAAMAGVTSGSFAFSLDVTQEGADGGTVTISGDGAFDASELAGMDMSAMQGGDMTAIFDGLKALVQGFNGDLTLNISAPPSAGLPGPLAFELLLIDGVGYLNFESVATLLGGPEMLTAMGLPTTWGGLDLVDTIEQLVALAGPSLEDSMGTMPDMSTMDPSQYEAFAQYFTFTREADADGAAVFSGTMDFAGLINDPTFMTLLQAQMAAQGQDIPADQMDEVMAMMSQMGDAFNISLTQEIDLATNFLRGIDFNMAIDGAALAAMGGGSDVPNITIAFSFDLTDHNAAPAISAPADAPVATFMQLMGLLGGGMQ